jgi:hypothetical protein
MFKAGQRRGTAPAPCLHVLPGVHERRYGMGVISRHRAADCDASGDIGGVADDAVDQGGSLGGPNGGPLQRAM